MKKVSGMILKAQTATVVILMLMPSLTELPEEDSAVIVMAVITTGSGNDN